MGYRFRSKQFPSTEVSAWFPKATRTRLPKFGFVPSDIAGLALWLDASDASTITESGGAVSQWNDKSSNGFNVAQATGAQQPTTGNTQNGLNVIQFSANKLLNAATASDWTFMSNGTPWIFGIVLYVTEQDPKQNMILLGTAVPASGASGAYIRYVTQFVGNPLLSAGIRIAFVGDISASTTESAAWKNAWNVGSGLISGSLPVAADRIKLARANDQPTGSNTSTATPSTSAPGYPLRIGFASPTNDFRIGELVIVSGADATETNRIKLRDYLNSKWAVY